MNASSRAWLLSLFLLFATVLARPARAADPLDPKAVPEPLRPWTAWVLDGQEEALCPQLLGRADTTRCLWPSRLELVLDEHGGRFAQSWHADAKGWAPLPGDDKRWPSAVTI